MTRIAGGKHWTLCHEKNRSAGAVRITVAGHCGEVALSVDEATMTALAHAWVLHEMESERERRMPKSFAGWAAEFFGALDVDASRFPSIYRLSRERAAKQGGEK